jgi:signal recognition particle subunit SRP54
MGKLLSMLPGAASMKKQIDNFDESEITRTKAIVQSMTPHERRDIKVLNGTRRSRIARGSGRAVSEVNSLVERFSAAQKAMKQMRSGNVPAGMPAAMGDMRSANPAVAHKKKSKSGNPAKRAAEERE